MTGSAPPTISRPIRRRKIGDRLFSGDFDLTTVLPHPSFAFKLKKFPGAIFASVTVKRTAPRRAELTFFIRRIASELPRQVLFRIPSPARDFKGVRRYSMKIRQF